MGHYHANGKGAWQAGAPDCGARGAIGDDCGRGPGLRGNTEPVARHDSVGITETIETILNGIKEIIDAEIDLLRRQLTKERKG